MRRDMACLTALALFVPTIATAQILPPPQSEQPTWGMELKMGPFRPRISDNFEEREYYKLIYATNNDRSMFENQPLLKTAELSAYFSHEYGLLGVVGGIGHWRVTDNTRTCVDPDGSKTYIACTPETVWDSESGNDVTDLTILPLSLGVVYRFDLVKRRWPVPLVPYVKAALDYALWWNTAGGKVSASADTRGKGGTWGYWGAVGLMLNLDWIEPNSSARARSSSGLADSYLTIELSQRLSDGFGDESRLHTSGRVVSIGIAVDML